MPRLARITPGAVPTRGFWKSTGNHTLDRWIRVSMLITAKAEKPFYLTQKPAKQPQGWWSQQASFGTITECRYADSASQVGIRMS